MALHSLFAPSNSCLLKRVTLLNSIRLSKSEVIDLGLKRATLTYEHSFLLNVTTRGDINNTQLRSTVETLVRDELGHSVSVSDYTYTFGALRTALADSTNKTFEVTFNYTTTDPDPNLSTMPKEFFNISNTIVQLEAHSSIDNARAYNFTLQLTKFEAAFETDLSADELKLRLTVPPKLVDVDLYNMYGPDYAVLKELGFESGNLTVRHKVTFQSSTILSGIIHGAENVFTVYYSSLPWFFPVSRTITQYGNVTYDDKSVDGLFNITWTDMYKIPPFQVYQSAQEIVSLLNNTQVGPADVHTFATASEYQTLTGIFYTSLTEQDIRNRLTAVPATSPAYKVSFFFPGNFNSHTISH